MVFRRKKKASRSAPPQGQDPDADIEASLSENPDEISGAQGTVEPGASDEVEVDRTSGPFDVGEVDDQEDRIDLGAVQIPMIDDLEVRVDVDPRNQRPAGVTLILGQGAVQVRPYSSPRSGGTWDEARSEIKAELAGADGHVEEYAGEFGLELQARVKATDQSGATGTQAIRFVGIEGPRWMLQGVFFGEGADPLTAGRLNAAYRSIVVVRGDGPMPAKQQLEITVPESDSAPVDAADDVLPEADGYQPPEGSVVHERDYDRSSGPYDVAEANEDLELLDLGGLKILFVDDLEINVEVDEDSDEVMAVTLVRGEGAVQVRPFSAQGTSGLWEDARAEIKAGISSDGGLVDEVSGMFGTELRAQVSAEDENGKPFIQPIRFVGVNGPGWMLQGIFLGEGTDPEAAADLEAIFRSVVVDATSEGVPAGHPLPLTSPQDLPEDVVEFEDDGS